MNASRYKSRPPLWTMLLLHYHCCAEAPPHADAPSVRLFTQDLLDAGLIKTQLNSEHVAAGWQYTTTERGKALVEAICLLPLPRLVEEPRYTVIVDGDLLGGGC